MFGGQMSMLDGWVLFDNPKLFQGANGPYCFVNVRELIYTDSNKKKHYQTVSLRFTGNLAEKFVAPYFHAGMRVTVFGRWEVRYEKTAEGYDDLQRIKSVFFNVKHIQNTVNKDGRPYGTRNPGYEQQGYPNQQYQQQGGYPPQQQYGGYPNQQYQQQPYPQQGGYSQPGGYAGYPNQQQPYPQQQQGQGNMGYNPPPQQQPTYQQNNRLDADPFASHNPSVIDDPFATTGKAIEVSEDDLPF